MVVEVLSIPILGMLIFLIQVFMDLKDLVMIREEF